MSPTTVGSDGPPLAHVQCPKSDKAIRIRLVPANFCLQMEAAAQISYITATDRRKVTLYLLVQRGRC